MAHCTKCGAEVAENAAFCPNCGQAQAGAAASGAAAQPGMAENVAGLLCYVLGWLTGLIFLLIDKRPFVRFHAAQSLVLFGGLHILQIILRSIFGYGWWWGGWGAWGMAGMLLMVLGLVTFILWIVCMIKAYQGERFRVPLAADLADSIAGR